MSDSPSAEEARLCWGSFAPEVRERAKKARIAGVCLDKVDENFETADEHLDPVTLGEAMEEAADYDVADGIRRCNRLEELDVLAKHKAYEPVGRRA